MVSTRLGWKRIVAHVAISSDLRGSVFAVDHNGDVFHNKHAKADGTGPMVQPGIGNRVGTGWHGVRQLVAVRIGDATCLAAIGPDGDLVASATTTTDPQFNAPAKVAAVPPGTRAMFSGTNNDLLQVTQAGALIRQPLTISSGGTVQAGPSTVVEPSGWADGFALFTNGDGVFFDITLAGVLRYQYVATPAGTPSGTPVTPSSANWVPLATGWSRYHEVFGGGAGFIYAIAAEGTLELRTYTVAADHTVTLDPRRRDYKVGSGMFPWTGLAADIEGYAWPMSVAAGDTVDISVGVRMSTPPIGVAANVPDPVTYAFQARRLRRWHNGTEADYDDVMPTPQAGTQFTATRYVAPGNLLDTGAGWSKSVSVKVPDLPPSDPGSWRSGIYAIQLIDKSGRTFYAPFVVRPKTPQNPFAVLANSNTWNAYNSWGGQGKYTHTYPLPGTLPFQRPHPGLTPDVFYSTPESQFTPYGPSVYTNSCHLLRAELWVLGWLEDLGPKYAFDVYTDHDLHAGNTGIGEGSKPAYKALILNTHPEYWTRAMYDRLKAHRDQGGSIVYLGGNGIYEAVELTEDGAHMPIFPGIDLSKYPPYINNEQIRLNCLMRAPMNSRPEHALIGVGFQHCDQGDAQGQPYNLQQDPQTKLANPVLAGLTIPLNAALGATSHDVPAPWQQPASAYYADGWEVDQRGAGTPPEGWTNEALIAFGNTNPDISGEMLSYITEKGGVVFAASSINFGGSMVVDPNMQRIVQNALDLCLAR